MKATPILLAICLLHFAGCSSTDPQSANRNTTGPELVAAYARPAAHFQSAKVSCTVVADGKTEQLPTLRLLPGRRATASKLAEHRYPTDFAFPQVHKAAALKSDGAFPVTPTTPVEFTSTKLGWTLELTASTRKGFIMLSGTLTRRSLRSMVRAEGVPFRPIVATERNTFGRATTVTLTPNSALSPAIETLSIPVFIAANSGETYRIHLDKSGPSFAEFTCQALR